MIDTSWLPSPLVVATHNPGKLAEWRILLTGVDLVAPDGLAEPEETESTYRGNAELKARYAARHTGHAALADDTGFEVEALEGAPGVLTAPWAARHGGYPAAYEALLARASPGTRASLVCAVALCNDGRVSVAQATVSGRLRAQPTDAPGFAALLDPDDGPLLQDGVLAHRRAALAQLKPCR